MNKLLSTFWMARRNFVIDIKFLTRTSYLPINERLEILTKKYQTLAYHLRNGYKTGENFATINNENIYYNTKYGLVGYQCLLAEQIFWVSKLKLHDKPVFIDIGANVGYFTLGCKKINSNAKIFAFEPAPPAYTALQKNIINENDVRIYNMALGNENRTIKLHVDYEQTSFSKITENDGVEVEMKTLDSVKEIESTDYVDLIKLDTEGYELNVLYGATNILKKTRYLLMELNPDEYTLTQISDILKISGKNIKLLFVRNFDLRSDGEFKSGDVLFELLG